MSLFPDITKVPGLFHTFYTLAVESVVSQVSLETFIREWYLETKLWQQEKGLLSGS
jgi:hypothetical protein